MRRHAWGLARDQFVSDIFHEVDEEVRREQLKKLWDRYGNLIAAAAILVVAGIAGFAPLAGIAAVLVTVIAL